jgi:hypothetical protein
MAAVRGEGHVGRRLGTLRGTLALAIAALLAVAGCGGANPDPYAVLDQARTANYDRIQVSLGFTAEVAAQADPNFPVQAPAKSINVDPSWITAAADIPTGRWHVRLAVPLDALGMANLGPFGLPFDAVDLEALSDGTDLYVQSPLLPMYFQGVGGPPVDGDLTGWVRLGSVEALAPLGGSMLFPFGMGGVPGLPANLPIPPEGDAAALRTLVTELGGTVEYAGTETVDGVELVHLKGGLNIVKLVQSQQFMDLTGMGRDQLQGIVAMEGRIGISTDIWVNKASGRLTTLRIEGTSIQTPVATIVVTLQVAEPGPEITFEAPAAFTDLDLENLIGNQFPGVGVPGIDVGGGDGFATMSPEEPEIIDDILDEVGEELEDELPTAP